MSSDVSRRHFIKYAAAGAALGALGLGSSASSQTSPDAAAPASSWGSPATPTARPAARRTVPITVGGKNRAVRVATVSQDGLPDRSLPETLQRMEEAYSRKPEIICLPEGAVRLTRGGEAIPGPVSEMFGAWAKERHVYVIVPYATLVDGRRYNASVLFDRQGEVVGQYHKAHPTGGECRSITPGPENPPVFETDFGTIGMQICFDANWPLTWKHLKENGAEIVFFSSAYPAHRDVACFARLNEYFVVSSARTRPSRVYDITGEVITQTGEFQQWTDAMLQLSKRLFEIDRHTGKMRAVEKKYGERIDVQWYHDDDRFTLASLDPNLAVEDIFQEFGLQPLRDYIAENQVAIDAARPA